MGQTVHPSSVEPLAILGGRPAFPHQLHVGRPNIGDRARFHQRIDEVLDRCWLTNNGPVVLELEATLADLLEVDHCVAVANATLGLQIAASDLEAGSEVIVPAFTFVATAHALRWIGLRPVFCDVDPKTHNLDPARVAELVTPRTRAILGVHVWGRPCDVTALSVVAEEHGLALLYDAAHAFGCAADGRPIGGFGRAEVFSFHATKFVNAFEGGAVTTDDADLAARLRLTRNFGFAGVDQVVEVGTNAKMSEVSAAMALTSLESLPRFVATNRANHEAYQHHLAGSPGIRVVEYQEADRPNYQYVIVEVDEVEAGLSRDDLVVTLGAENVLARRYFFPGCHRMEPYASEEPMAAQRLPVTEHLTERLLALPTGTAMTTDDVALVCRVIERAIDDAPRIRAARRPPIGELLAPQLPGSPGTTGSAGTAGGPGAADAANAANAAGAASAG